MTLYPAQNIPARLSAAMLAANLSYRKAAALIGISTATTHRIAQGKLPDVESFLKVKAWLAQSPHNPAPPPADNETNTTNKAHPASCAR